jgi:YggT family protein
MLTAIVFIGRTIIDFYALLLLLRAWLYGVVRDPHNPFYQLTAGWTQPVVRVLYRLLPLGARVDGAALLLAFVLLTLRASVLLLLQTNSASSTISPLFYCLLGLLALLKCSGRLLFWVLLLRALGSWINYRIQPIDYTLQRLTEPLLQPIRRRLPETHGLDFSVMALMLLLITLDYLGGDLFAALWSYL